MAAPAEECRLVLELHAAGCQLKAAPEPTCLEGDRIALLH